MNSMNEETSDDLRLKDGNMIITVNILAVDGETHLSMTGSLIAARQFLKNEDHEGSSIEVKIEAYGVEAYSLLKDHQLSKGGDPS